MPSTFAPTCRGAEHRLIRRAWELRGFRSPYAYFGTSDGYWINLQAHFDLEMAKDKVGKQAARINPHPHGADGSLQPV